MALLVAVTWADRIRVVDETNEDHEAAVEAVIAALEPLGFEPVVVCTDGSEPCASLRLGAGVWLDVSVRFVEGGD